MRERENRYSLLDTVGNTPLIEICKLNPKYPSVRIFAKLEGANPGGSVKDRPALFMIRKAEEDGTLTKGKIVVEPTSGNTGIALAMICALKGYKVRLFMPECVSVERRRILEALGADLILTPADEGTDGAIIRAKTLVDEEPDHYFMPDQFTNPANVLSHYKTTGPEIINQIEDGIDYFIAGMGTTGTLMGTGEYLRENLPDIRIIGIEPVKNHRIQGLKNMKESIVPAIYDEHSLDDKFYVNDAESFEMARRLAREEGLFVGMSSGAALAGVLKLLDRVNHCTVVTVFPDKGERYLSTTLFASICSECPP